MVSSNNRQLHRIEEACFTKTPAIAFDERKRQNVSYIYYFKERHGFEINEQSQPMLLVTPNNCRRKVGDSFSEIYLIPELYNTVGLTDK